MPRVGLALLALAAAAPAARPQTPPAGQGQPGLGTPVAPGGNRVMTPGSGTPPAAAALPPQVPASDPRVDPHLRAWENRLKEVNSLYCEKVEKTVRNNTFQKETRFVGWIECLKPNLANVAITNAADKTDTMTWVCDGRQVHEYQGKAKKYTAIPIPAGNQGGGNLLLDFMSGRLDARLIKERFGLKLHSEEEHYVHLQILPVYGVDKQEFESAMLVLYGPKTGAFAYLPAAVVMTKSLGQETETWRFREPLVNHKGITPQRFVAPPVPAGWAVDRVPPQAVAGQPPAGGVPPKR